MEKHFIAELLLELSNLTEDEQKQKIWEMNGLLDEMNEKEMEFVLKIAPLNIVSKMIGDHEIPVENAVMLLKHIGRCKMKNDFVMSYFDRSLLNRRLKMIIIEEDRKKEGKNEKLLNDLCECYQTLRNKVDFVSDELVAIIVHCLLKIASNKEESEETREEVEMALVALNNNRENLRMKKEVYLNDITEIIKHHQKHHNLTLLAYQSAWQFLMFRFINESQLEHLIVNKLHFVREATREMEELMERVDRKKKKGEKGEKETKEAKEMKVLSRWVLAVREYFWHFQLWNDENIGLIRCLVKLCKATRENERETFGKCMVLFQTMMSLKTMRVDDLMKGGIFELFLEEIQRPTLNDDVICKCLGFFMAVSGRMKGKQKNKIDDEKWNETKKAIFDKLEEEGYEDAIISFLQDLETINEAHSQKISGKATDYFVNVRGNEYS
eukprot:MONOS_5577.1-p1 / transcript=MONOS_5577.1 / gene=MONOS_5577 / organism=Monocercomonoides_exilis_PA203 / gene_product=unspecified product / transcript_product=unspecified product / location=Mono_scaffold00164:36320-37700(-) / protein_length=439 / sequence_SO=supercontig / SO=protein_coding / is_pseudo=false